MKRTLIISQIAIFLCAATLVLGQKTSSSIYPKSGIIKLKSGPYCMSISASRQYTICGLKYKNKELLTPYGSNGTILIVPKVGMVGAAYKKNGAEKIVALKLKINGKLTPIESCKTYAGKSVTLEKESIIGGFRFFKLIKLDSVNEIIDISNRYNYEKEQKLSSIYFFILGWKAQFNDYIVSTSKGIIPGHFEAKCKWRICKDINWLAMYSDKSKLCAVTALPTYIPGASRKNTVWDHKAYQKYYLFARIPDFKKDKKSPEYKLRLKVFESTSNAWKNQAAKAAKEMKAYSFKKLASSKTSPQRKLNPYSAPDFGDISNEDWETNRRGIEALDPDYVLPPFENVKAASNNAKVWNRQYFIAGNGLLDKVLIDNESFFSRPMTLSLIVDGKKIQLKTTKTKLILNKKGRAIYERIADSSKLTVKALTTIEYDGMVRVDMEIIPKGKIKIDKFDYAFHLPRKNALFTHFVGCPDAYNKSIMLPSESYSMAVPKRNGVFFEEPFKTLVWFGNHDKGFLWFCGSEKNWSPQAQAKRPAALKADANSKEVSFKVTPVSKPYEIDKKISYTFGFFATPVRPMPKKWRTWLFTTRRAAYGSEAQHGYVGNMPMIWPDEFRTLGAYPRIKDKRKVKKFINDLHSQGRNALTYCDPIRVNAGRKKYIDVSMRSQQLNDLYLAKPGSENDIFKYRPPEVAKNLKNWQTLPALFYNYGSRRGENEVRVSSASSWADFFLFLVEKMAIMGLDGFGDIDNCFPIMDMNAAHGAGYIGQDGKRHAEWDWFARRDLMKRLVATFLKVRKGKPPIMVSHASATWSIPFISFCDANMVYEHSNSGYFLNPRCLSKYGKHNKEITNDLKNGGKTFLRWAFPKERWQAELSGHQFGLPCVIMPNLTKSPKVDKQYAKSERAAREVGAFVLAHDNILWPIWCNTKPLIEIVKIREKFGISEEDVKFIPYWSKTNPVTSSNPAIKVTIYIRPNKTLVNVCNLSNKSAKSIIDFKQLKPENLINAETGKPADLINGSIEVDMNERDYQIFVLTQKEN
jgi:hypothetical protein